MSATFFRGASIGPNGTALFCVVARLCVSLTLRPLEVGQLESI
jgi:hypothetical protein